MLSSFVLAACQPSVIVGVYRDGGARCDPLSASCGGGMACTLRGDPAMDACRAIGTLALGAPCTTLDACVAGAQCVRIAGTSASLAPADVALGGRCRAVCARDAPDCAATEHCTDVTDGAGGTRLDFGVCAP